MKLDSRKRMLAVGTALLLAVLTGCGGGDNQETNATPSDGSASSASSQASAPASPSESASGETSGKDALEGTYVGAKMSYFEAKFGAGTRSADEMTVSFQNGKLRVLDNDGIAYTIYNAYVDRGETPSPEEALAFISEFLPGDAKLVKEEENAESKITTYTYASEALDEATGLGGQLLISIMKNPEDVGQVRQAQIAIDILAGF